MRYNFEYNLKSCVWELTLECCYSCKYCGSRARKARMGELNTEDCLRIVCELKDLGCQRVTLIGGEVFLRSDWNIIAKELIKNNIRVSIVSNGSLLTDQIAEQIKDLGIESVAISVDGTEYTHDEFRCKGSFRKAIQAIDILKKHQIIVSVITTLHPQNVSQLNDMLEMFKRERINVWQLQACSPMGYARNQEVYINFSEVIQFVEKNFENEYFPIGIADNLGYYSEMEGYLRGSSKGFGSFIGCRAGINVIGIDSIGNVRGCESLYDECFIEGNLKKQSLKSIWNNPESFAYNRYFTVDKLSGRCRMCRFGSVCGGGCRSYNYFSGGNLYESLYCIRSEMP